MNTQVLDLQAFASRSLGAEVFFLLHFMWFICISNESFLQKECKPGVDQICPKTICHNYTFTKKFFIIYITITIIITFTIIISESVMTMMKMMVMMMKMVVGASRGGWDQISFYPRTFLCRDPNTVYTQDPNAQKISIHTRSQCT